MRKKIEIWLFLVLVFKPVYHNATVINQLVWHTTEVGVAL